MSERPEWMPSAGEMYTIDGRGDPTSYTSHEKAAIEQAHHRTGLRARLDALELLIEGQTGHMVDRAKKMIEEIRKELEG